MCRGVQAGRADSLRQSDGVSKLKSDRKEFRRYGVGEGLVSCPRGVLAKNSWNGLNPMNRPLTLPNLRRYLGVFGTTHQAPNTTHLALPPSLPPPPGSEVRRTRLALSLSAVSLSKPSKGPSSSRGDPAAEVRPTRQNPSKSNQIQPSDQRLSPPNIRTKNQAPGTKHQAPSTKHQAQGTPPSGFRPWPPERRGGT
jgi:hypothetical protein